uniref:Vacuolar protein sorting-associated protein 62 n=1 Tax=Arundo donax TaxID=35708 RepID=A0A0A9FYA5_ARUDO
MICIGELDVVNVTKFQSIWSCSGATFYEPEGVPDGFHCLGHYAQQNDQPLQGYVLVAREVANHQLINSKPALEKPLDYSLVWTSANLNEDDNGECGCFWSPSPPDGYKALGYLVTKGPMKPSLEAVRCVRDDLTDACENFSSIVSMESACQVGETMPCHRGVTGRGIPVGTFSCETDSSNSEESTVPCLKNFDSDLRAMPNLEQIHALIKHYGPTVFFHPQDTYLPSSVSWFFENGATLYKKGVKMGDAILAGGSNLPAGGTNDGEYWIDLPDDERNEYVKVGNLKSAELYAHVKPAHGGTFTDIAMWVFCPFNGPATIKVGFASFALQKVGRHIGDWEHFTLRISNFSGELSSIYFSQHSGGQWVDACDLEFISGNKAIVYSSRNGHASYPHPGCYLMGSEKLGVGVRNDVARSDLSADSSTQYKIISAVHLGDAVVEPCWLQYMREWGPTITYNSRSEIDTVLSFLPFFLRFTAEAIFNSLPVELYEEEGPTGPKEKNNWEGDERC